MTSAFHDKFKEDLELIYAKYSNPFNGAPELTLSTCDLPESVQIIENYKYSRSGKWMVLEENSDDAYELQHDPAQSDSDTSVEDDMSDEEYQSGSYDLDCQNSSDGCGSIKLEKCFRAKYPRSCAEKDLKTHPVSTTPQIPTDIPKPMPNNHQISNVNLNQLYYEDEEQTSSEIELSRHSSVDCFKPTRTVTISKDLWTRVQQCLHLMIHEFGQLNSKCDDENHFKKLNERQLQSRRQSSLKCKSSVKQKLFSNDYTFQSTVPRGGVVEKLFVRHKAMSGPGIELASRQSFLNDTKSKISEVESLDSVPCQVNSSLIKTPTQPFQPPSQQKRRRRYRLVRRRPASCKTQGKSSSHTPMNECNFDPPRNLHFAKNKLHPCPSTGTSNHESDRTESCHVDGSNDAFDQCLIDINDFQVSKKTKPKEGNGTKQNERCSCPELHDVMLIEAPVVHTKVESPQILTRNGRQPLTIEFQTNSVNRVSPVTESSQGHRCSSTSQKHDEVNVTNSRDPACKRRPLFKQHSNTSAESMPSPIRSTSNTNLTETSANSTFGNAPHPTLPNIQNIKDSSPHPTSSRLDGTILQPRISLNYLGTNDISTRRSTYNIHSGQNDGYLKKRFSASPLLSHVPSGNIPNHNIPVDNLLQHGCSVNNQYQNMMMSSNVRQSTPKVISRKEASSASDYSRSELNTNTPLVCSPMTQIYNSDDDPTTQPPTDHCERDAKVITSEKLKGQNDFSNKFSSPSHNRQEFLQLNITPRRAKFHPYSAFNRSRSPPLISPFQSLNIKSPSSRRSKWTTLDRSPMAICVKESRRIPDPTKTSRKNLKFDYLSSDNEKIKAQEERCDQIKDECNPKNRQRNNTDCRVEDSRYKCSAGKCTKTFCFNCSMDLS